MIFRDAVMSVFAAVSQGHVLIMVDGKRLGGELSYNSANAWDVDRIRMEDVERVEIIRGPAGALYGSDAMAGGYQCNYKNSGKKCR